jgi:hypothetical protein
VTTPGRFRRITPEEIWNAPPGEARQPEPFHLVVLGALIFIGAVVGAFGSIGFPLSFGVNLFWTGIVVQQVGSIWFGAWGVIAGSIFPFFSNAVDGTPWVVSLAYLPANFMQSFLPAWAFRRLKVDPRLMRGRDYAILLSTMLISSLVGALWSVLVVLRGFELLHTDSVAQFIWGWFGGNFMAGLVFNFLTLKAFSAMVIRAGALVKRWWA